MNYIYDVLANFSDEFFDFFDWNESDDIVHIKKLPIIRVNSDFFYNVKFNSVNVSNDLLEIIFKKTEFFKGNKNKYGYVCALCDSCSAFIVRFDYKGKVLGRSSMLPDEENEVIDISECMNVSDFDIKVYSVGNGLCFNTRREYKLKEFFCSKIKKMNYDKLMYLYFDCFNNHENNINIILDRLFYEIENNFDSIYENISNFLELTSINK